MTKSRQQSTKLKVKETDPTWNHVFSSLLQKYRWRINGTFCLRSRKKSGANSPKSNFTCSKKKNKLSAFTENQSQGFLLWFAVGFFFSHCVVKITWKRRAQVAVFWSAWRDKWKFCYCCSVSCIQLLATTWTKAYQTSLSFTMSQSLLRLMFIVLMLPSKHLIFWSPILPCSLIFPSTRVFSSELALCIRWPKDWRFSFSVSPSNEYSGLISFSIDWSPCCPKDS